MTTTHNINKVRVYNSINTVRGEIYYVRPRHDLSHPFGGIMTRKRVSITLVTFGMLLVVFSLVWWMIYYAKAAELTRGYDGSLVALLPCAAYDSERCQTLSTDTELPSMGAFLEDEDETVTTYLQALAAPDGIVEYRPFVFWIGMLMAGVGLVLAFTTPNMTVATFANDDLFVAYLFVLPSLVGFAVFFLYPAIGAIQLSFHEWNLLRAPKFVGLENFQELFTDRRFWRSLRVTLLYVVINIPIQTALALILAVIMDRFSNAVSSIVRGLMVLPWLLPPVVVGLLWLWMLDPLLGIINVLLGFVGIPR
ncbi:MAG: sugar ABC transporter permease, partial [Deinococcota bacterium]